MILHILSPGETLYSVARRYGIPPANLAADNGILTPERLPTGMVLLISEPVSTHTVAPGETLYSIARRYGIPLRTLWRNNLFLKGGTTIRPGDVLFLEVKKEPLGSYPVGGYVYPYINQTLLEQTLPLVSGIMPFTYGFTPQGSLVPLNDNAIIDAAFRYSVSPVMHLSTLTESGNFSTALAEGLLADTAVQEVLTESLLAELRRKGYYALDVDFEFLGQKNAQPYAEFLSRLRTRLNREGYPLLAALAPKTSDAQPGVLYEGHDYAAIGEAVNSVLLMTYEWGYTYGPPMAVSPIQPVRRVVEYALTRIPGEKIFLGLSNYGYDFTLPYTQGLSRANSLSIEEAIRLAGEVGTEILYDERVQAPYFLYTKEGEEHRVWFEDARSLSARWKLVREYGLRGALYWNFDRPNPQNLALLNQLLYPAAMNLW